MTGRDLADWSELSLADLFFAYRKAKVDCFYESSIRVAESFVDYEQSLPDKLTALLVRLKAGEAATILTDGIKQPIIFPKRLHFEQQAPERPGGGAREAHAFFSDAERAFRRSTDQHMPIPEFRLIGDFSVEAHVLSALWVNLIGHKFDACLSSRALASRVRRYRADKDRKWVGDYHLESLGSFEPYFEPYRKWRDDGLRAMRDAMKRGQPIIAMTLDVGNFYHSIDPRFFIDARFLQYLGVKLSPFELGFSQLISAALSEWSARCRTSLSALGCPNDAMPHAGIPIGLSVVRVISNVLLAFLDRQVERQLSPIYYARYVDDLFLVLHDSDDISSPSELWDFITQRVSAFKRDSTGNVRLTLPEWSGGTQLTLQAAKQKTFFLSGRSGSDLLDHIASQIREVSSERRTMPLPEHIERSHAARALAATDSADDDADSLRRADGLSLRRLGWSVLLRAVNTLARDLLPQDWRPQRDDFYDFAHEHVIRPDKVLEQVDHLPRLLSFAVSLGDWVPARRVYRETLTAISKLEEGTQTARMRINGIYADAVPPEVWHDTREQVRRFFREALIRAYPISSTPPRARAFAGLVKDLGLTVPELTRLARQAREGDWARVPYREHLRTDAVAQPAEQPNEALLAGQYQHVDCLRQFLDRTERNASAPSSRRVARLAIPAADDQVPRSILPFLFPTRPYTPEEIALYLPDECVFDEPIAAAHAWADYTRAMRGVWVRGDLAGELEAETLDVGDGGDGRRRPASAVVAGSEDRRSPIIVKRSAPRRAVRLGLTSFEVTDKSWEKGAAGDPDLSPRRYWQLASIVNTAILTSPKPDYLLLPELSVPERWINTIAGRLRASGISLIAGVDYVHHLDKQIDSSAVLVLTDDRLGYASSIQVRQRKSLPAPGEEEQLYASHGLSWAKGTDPKRVYQHNGLYFGILVCSELQNMGYRANFQGQVDCLITLSWNKDLESFSALIDAAALDVHAYMALVNNRRYGDSRLRRPAKKPFDRDVCRVRGGLNDQLVVVEIEPTRLRRQQSREKRWPRATDAYKPAPEGFNISAARKCIPD